MQNLEALKALALELPDEALKNNALDLVERMGAVVEGIGDRAIAWRPPLLRLVQGTTDRSSIPKGTAIGDFVLGEEKMEAPLNFIPLRTWTSRQYWDPDQTNNRMLCQSPDAKVGYIGAECRSCPHSQWVEGEGADCNKVISALFITSDLAHVFSVNFAKTGYTVGADFEALLRKAGVAPYQRVYSLSSGTSSKNKNVEVFKIEALDAASRRTPEAYIPFLKELFNQINSSRQEMLTAFYENIAARRDAGTLQIQLDKGTEALPAPEGSGSSEVTDIESTPAEAPKVSSKAKNYSV